MKYYLIIIILITTVFACDSNQKPRSPEVLMLTDIEFSRMSEEKGIGDAFIFFADSNAVILRNKKEPLVGLEAVSESFGKINPDEVKLTWKPIKAEIAQSGDLGYTFGKYERVIIKEGEEKLQTGYYLTTWKKQKDGSWKYVTDSGS